MHGILNLRRAFLLLFSLACLAVCAQTTADYYAGAKGKKGKELKTSLSKIIVDHEQRSYKQLWEDFKTTDARPDGKVWDMYSNVTSYVFGSKSQGANYSGEGDSYNREHSFPKSWFNDEYPMYTDLHHLYPTDGYVNGRRSNYPYGETDGDRYQTKNGFSKLGQSKIPGYNGIVFEPNDEYKGDLARTYFYMVTAYETKVAKWNSEMLNHTAYPAFTDWALTMFLRWSFEDPVSEKETNRNEAVYAIQHNRNPYIDYPGLEQYVWGTMMSAAFNPYAYVAPDSTVTPEPNPEPNPNPNPDPDPNPDPTPNPDANEQLYLMATSTADLTVGQQVIIVCNSKQKGLSAPEKTYRLGADVKVTDAHTVTTATNEKKLPTALIVGQKDEAYTFLDTQTKEWLSFSGGKNTLTTTQNAADKVAQWTVSISPEGAAKIAPKLVSDRTIQYNPQGYRFACYTSSQQAVSIYVKQTPEGISQILQGSVLRSTIDVYDLNGRCLYRGVEKDRVRQLPAGIYVVNGHKILVR